MNRIHILSIFIFFHLFTFGQNFNAGGIIGINTSQVSGDNLSGFNKLGVRIGGFVNREFNAFTAQIELQYIKLERGVLLLGSQTYLLETIFY